MNKVTGRFLTDAFASGHLMDSTAVQAAIQLHLKAHPIKTANPEMQTIAAGLEVAGLAVPLTLKNIHDRLNVEGFTIRNAAGMTWKTYGDGRLRSAMETQRIGALAVFNSRQQIDRAHGGESPDSQEVLDLLPDAETIDAATRRAIAYVPQAVEEITPLIHQNLGLLDTLRVPAYLGGPLFPLVAKSVLGTLSGPGRQRTLDEYDERKRLDPATPYPSTPLLRWDFHGL